MSERSKGAPRPVPKTKKTNVFHRQVAVKRVEAALDAVESDHPGFKALVLDGEGRQHRFVKLFINEEAIPSDALDTPLGDSDRLEVLAAIAGG